MNFRRKFVYNRNRLVSKIFLRWLLAREEIHADAAISFPRPVTTSSGNYRCLFSSCLHNIYDLNTTSAFKAFVVRAAFRGVGSSKMRLVDYLSIPYFHVPYGKEVASATEFTIDRDFLIQSDPCWADFVVMVFVSGNKVLVS